VTEEVFLMTTNGSVSPWSLPSRSDLVQLDHDARADVCIIGAGIAGLSVAYGLIERGRRVIVLDDGEPGCGETSRTTAHLTVALDQRYVELERIHGPEGARIAAESHAAAIDAIETIIARESIECEFERVDGYLFAASATDQPLLELEAAAARRAGIAGVKLVDRAPVSSFETGRCLRFPRQAQLHAGRYVSGLTDAVCRRGAEIHVNTHVARIDESPDLRIVTREGHVVICDAVVVATNSPISDIVAIHTKQAAYRTYVIGAKVATELAPRILLWDTADPYHYVRSVGANLLLVGGEDHKTGQEDDGPIRFARLEAWARERFPVEQIDYRWSGQILEPVDGIAFIGQDPATAGRVFVATGHSGNGMTNGSIAGMLIPDLIAGNPNHWSTLYDPARISLGAAGDYMKENANVAVQYADWLGPADRESADAVAAGSGAVVQCGMKKVAVYRSHDNTLHTMSAACPHLGCVVAWNAVERSWDCPCHGSRFEATGGVINGPANVGLSPVELEATVESQVAAADRAGQTSA
jgi:glycine/D-amino acid oxidase-like deaminating enzyme/nitrite reductase/ring-hydroxylating ferredoxin subunit